MSRAVTADHVLFDECIRAFRSDDERWAPFEKGPSYSFLLTPFEISIPWQFKECHVASSVQVRLPGANSAFISKVCNPEHVGGHNSHLFGIALSAIASFSWLKPCKSTRDDYLCRREHLTDSDYSELALNHAVLVAGPGANHSRVSDAKLHDMYKELEQLMSKLLSVDIKTYRIAMQSIRLVHLSLLVKRDDFGLAYLLVVSAIEAVAQHAVKRNKVKQKHPKEAEWKLHSKEDSMFKELFESYLESRGNNQYLRERFVLFIEKFAPIEKWTNYIEHPMSDVADTIRAYGSTHSSEHLTRKNWFEKYPEDLSPKEISSIISDAYVHRSCFIHRGEQPPHTDPSPSFHRFFQDYRSYDGYELTEKLLPNYELLIGLAKHSITNWLNTKLKT
ncbi:Apea-like HEPN domain-containing protein [Vibrio crassostreae]|nr:Apea-like HEPN domain-containing protein [Vibrio crassostreae]